MKNTISSNKSAEAVAKNSVTISLILHTVSVFAIACVILFSYIMIGKVWVIATGIITVVGVTVYTHKYFCRCLSDFCNSHIHIVSCIAESISCAFSSTQDHRKILSQQANEIFQCFETMINLDDELDSLSTAKGADKQEVALEPQDEGSDNL